MKVLKGIQAGALLLSTMFVTLVMAEQSRPEAVHEVSLEYGYLLPEGIVRTGLDECLLSDFMATAIENRFRHSVDYADLCQTLAGYNEKFSSMDFYTLRNIVHEIGYDATAYWLKPANDGDFDLSQLNSLPKPLISISADRGQYMLILDVVEEGMYVLNANGEYQVYPYDYIKQRFKQLPVMVLKTRTHYTRAPAPGLCVG